MTPSPGPPTIGASQIDWSTVWAVTGIVLALVAIIVGAYFARRYGSRRTRLQIDWRVRPLVPFSFVNLKGELEVIGAESPPRFGVELRIKNKGPQDIRADQFDGHAMRLSFGVPLVRNGHWSNGDSGFLELQGATALMRPRRLSADAEALHYFIRCLGETPPMLLVSDPPSDVRVKVRRFQDLATAVGIGAG